MAIPPTYADLGKSAKDIFNKGYGNVFNNTLLHVKITFSFLFLL